MSCTISVAVRLSFIGRCRDAGGGGDLHFLHGNAGRSDGEQFEVEILGHPSYRSITFGTRKKTPSLCGALAKARSRGRDGRGSSERSTSAGNVAELATCRTCAMGSTLVVST